MLGNAGVDLVLPVPRLPRPGETLVATGLSRAPGGKGLNQAVVAARAGAETLFLAPVGDDPDGHFVALRLQNEPFAALRLVTVPHPTDLSLILVGADAENSIVTAGPCAEALDEDTAIAFAAAAEPGDVLMLQGNLSQSVTRAAASTGRERGAVVLLNPAPLRWPADPVLAWCDTVVANRLEASAITGFEEVRTAALALLERGPATAIVTLGADGCLCADRTGVRLTPAPSVAAVDSTGAGDTFCGLLAACMARGWAMERGIAAAQRAAALTVTRAGAYDALPQPDELAWL